MVITFGVLCGLKRGHHILHKWRRSTQKAKPDCKIRRSSNDPETGIKTPHGVNL